METDNRRRLRLTARDRVLLEFLAEHRLARPGHVRALLGVSAWVAHTRLRRLTEAGYLDKHALFHNQPPCFQITRKGLAAVGSTLPAPRLDLRCYEHDVGVAWVWLAAGAGAFGPLAGVVSERAMRSGDGRAGPGEPRLGVRLREEGPRGGERLHYPDLMLHTGSGHRVAVELELSSKGKRRLESVIRSYAMDGRVDAVLYLVADDRIGRKVQEAARSYGIGQLVHVQRVQLTEPAGMPARARAIERAAVRPAGRTGTGGAER